MKRTKSIIIATFFAATIIFQWLVPNGLAYHYADTTNHWASSYIDKVTNAGAYAGSGNYFYPNTNEKRIDFVLSLSILLGEMSFIYNNQNTQVYSDVPAGSLNAGAVLWAKNNGITQGINPGVFGPNLNISREQLCTFIYRACNRFGFSLHYTTPASSFSDSSSISDWARSAVTALQKAEIINGYPDGTFKPKKSVSRAEVSAIVSRLMENCLDVIKDAPTKSGTFWIGIVDNSWTKCDFTIDYQENGALTDGQQIRYYYRRADQTTDLSVTNRGIRAGFLSPIAVSSYSEGSNVLHSFYMTENPNVPVSGNYDSEQHYASFANKIVNQNNSIIAKIGYAIDADGAVIPYTTTISVSLSN